MRTEKIKPCLYARMDDHGHIDRVRAVRTVPKGDYVPKSGLYDLEPDPVEVCQEIRDKLKKSVAITQWVLINGYWTAFTTQCITAR